MIVYELVYGLGCDPAPEIVKRSTNLQSLEKLKQILVAKQEEEAQLCGQPKVGWYEINNCEVDTE